MREPNFFLVGAAKSATTSLYHYLKQHPNVFLSEPKEPKFLSRNFKDYPHRGLNDDYIDRKKLSIKDIDDYLSLFSQAKDRHKVIGEASADYLYYHDTAKVINERFPGSKIVIMLRNPIDRAYSAYTHQVREGNERLSFMAALEKEEERILQNYQFIWHYKKAGLYYEQVKKYLEVFGEKNVQIIIYEKFKGDEDTCINRVCEFLGLSYDYDINTGFSKNVSGVHRDNIIYDLLFGDNLLKDAFKKIVGPDIRYKIKRYIISKNIYKEDMSVQARGYLRNYYKENVMNLRNLLDSDLEEWDI